MRKRIVFFLLPTMIISLTAAMGLAGTLTVNHGAAGVNYQAAREALGAVRTFELKGFAGSNGAISYVPSQNLVTANLIAVTLTNATFDGNTVYVCTTREDLYGSGANLMTYYATPVATSSVFNFRVFYRDVNSGDPFYLSSSPCTVAADAAANRIFRFKSIASPADNGTVQITVLTPGGLVIDSAPAVTLYTVANEYGISQTSTNHTLDYLGTPGNGTQIISGAAPQAMADSQAAASAANAFAITRTAYEFNCNTNAAGGSNAVLTVGATAYLTDSVSWQGISRVYLMDSGTACSSGAGNIVATRVLQGTAILSIPQTSFDGTAAKAYNLCVEGDGTSSLLPRTIKAFLDVYAIGPGTAAMHVTSSYAPAQVWGLNAYQALLPWIVNSSTGPTYCLVNNYNTSVTANVLLDILGGENAAVISGRSLGTLPPQTSRLVTFTGNSVAMAGNTAIDLTALGTDGRYSSRLTVTLWPSNASAACLQTDPVTGGKQMVPVLASDGVDSPYKQ